MTLHKLLGALLAIAPLSVAAQNISLKWGLDSHWSYYEERRARHEDAANRAEGPKEFRAFGFRGPQPEGLEAWLECLHRLDELRRQFQQEERKAGASRLSPYEVASAGAARSRFQSYAIAQNPRCVGLVQKAAPVLHFDFVLDAGGPFTLEKIVVTTIDFSEYMGGGFVVQETAFDLLLSHSKGVKTYPMDQAVVFKDGGRVKLRLWSDNWGSDVGGMAPMGEYLIDIQFVFSVNGRTASVATGPFKIDV